MKSNWNIIQGNVLEVIDQIEDNSINLGICSPPYWGLRDYGEDTNTVVWDGDEDCEHEWGINQKIQTKIGRDGNTEDKIHKKASDNLHGSTGGNFCNKCNAWKGQLGLEPTFKLYIFHLVLIFDAIKPKLRKDGSLWVNLGDTYYGGGNAQGHTTETKQFGQKVSTIETGKVQKPVARGKANNIKAKSLIGIPDRFKIAMIDNGWVCRNEIIWHKPSTMPSSAKDRFTVDFEKFFFFTKNKKYYFKQQFEPMSIDSIARLKRGVSDTHKNTADNSKTGLQPHSLHKTRKHTKGQYNDGHSGYFNKDGSLRGDMAKGRNMRTTWSINPKGFKEAHFACVDEQTEILTIEGWKNHNTLSIQDDIATFNISNEKLYYHKPYGIYKYEYNDELVVIENRYIAQYITPNHRVLLQHKIRPKYKSDKYTEWNYLLAQDLTPLGGIHIPISGEYDGYIDNINSYQSALVGWIICDGSLKKTSTGYDITIYQSQSANPQKVKMIRDLLDNCEIQYSERIRDRIIYNKQSIEVVFYLGVKTMDTWDWILDWINDDKTPKWKLLHIIQKPLKSMYDAIILADGNTRDDGRQQFTQKNDYNREWFRVLCTHLGKRTTEYVRKDGSSGTINVTHKNYGNIHSSKFYNTVSKIEYKGVVWCPNVPNTNFVARRKAKDGMYRIFITGNTYPETLIETPIDACCPEKICTECDKPVETKYEVPMIKNRENKRKDKRLIGDNTPAGVKKVERPPPNAGTRPKTMKVISCKCNAPTRRGIVLDPFSGSGTTGLVALKQNKAYIGIEINPEYIKIANKRLKGQDKIPLDEFFTNE